MQVDNGSIAVKHPPSHPETVQSAITVCQTSCVICVEGRKVSVFSCTAERGGGRRRPGEETEAWLLEWAPSESAAD